MSTVSNPVHHNYKKRWFSSKALNPVQGLTYLPTHMQDSTVLPTNGDKRLELVSDMGKDTSNQACETLNLSLHLFLDEYLKGIFHMAYCTETAVKYRIA